MLPYHGCFPMRARWWMTGVIWGVCDPASSPTSLFGTGYSFRHSNLGELARAHMQPCGRAGTIDPWLYSFWSMPHSCYFIPVRRESERERESDIDFPTFFLSIFGSLSPFRLQKLPWKLNGRIFVPPLRTRAGGHQSQHLSWLFWSSVHA